MELKAAFVVILSVLCHARPTLANNDHSEVEQHVTCKGPRAVHFFAANPGVIHGHMHPIPFSDVTLNEGLAFSGDSGIFMAPVCGIYQFFYSAQSTRHNKSTFLCLKVNGECKVFCHSHVSHGSTVGSMCTYMAELASKDQVTVSLERGDTFGDNSSRFSTFSGSLLTEKSA